MRCFLQAFSLTIFLLFGVTAFAGQPTHQVRNVVLILADDLGWSDTTLYGNTSLYKTPNIERLANRGVVFTNAYAASPLCSPTRASILLGQTPARSGHTSPQHHTGVVRMRASIGETSAPGRKAVEPLSATRLDTALPTLGKQLHNAGIRTAHFGKWHLGHPPYSPLEHGFEVDIPHWPGPGPAGNFVAPWAFPDFKPNTPNEHIEDRMADEAVKWMRTVKDEPFYMQYWQFSVHAPFDAKQDLIDLYRKDVDRNDEQQSPTYAAMVHSLDDAVGTLLDELDRLGIADETAIVFVSDNGGNMYNGIRETDVHGNEYVAVPTSNRPLRGGKASVFEGGVRTPCIIVWPGVTQAATRCDIPIQSTDLYPTIHRMLGVEMPADHPVDGVDITPALKGDEDFDRGPIFTYFPHSPGVPDWLPPSMAVRDGDWKLIRLFWQGENGKHDYLLYDLSKDIGEKTNLADAMPEKVQELDALIERHIVEGHVVAPKPNPNFDPAQYHPENIGVQQGGPSVGATRAERTASFAPVTLDEPLRGAATLDDWKVGRETVGLREHDGELLVHSIAGDAWVETWFRPPIENAGPFVLKFEILPDTVGRGVRVYATDKAAAAFSPNQRVDVPAPAKDRWTQIEARLSVDTLHGLRINGPTLPGETRFRNVQILGADGALLREWYQKDAQPGTPVAPPTATRPDSGGDLGGWRTMKDTAMLHRQDGVLVVDSSEKDPWVACFLAQPLGQAGPFTLSMEVEAEAPGDMRIHYRNTPGKAFSPKTMQVAKVRATGRWVNVKTSEPLPSPIHAIRISPPNAPGVTRLRNIRLINPSGATVAKWFDD